MLGKLLKYEFRSFSRLLGVIYIAVLAIAVVTGLLLRGSLWSESLASGNRTALIIFIIMYVVVILALVLITIWMIVDRFYKSMLGGEGYLTHTLPVPTWLHMTGKTISGVIYIILSGVVLLISALLLLVCSNLGGVLSYGLSGTLSEFSDFLGDILWENRVALVLGIIAMLLQIVRLILMFYASMAIGGSAKKNKIFLSVVAFIVIVIIINVVGSLTNRGLMEDLLFDYSFIGYYSGSGHTLVEAGDYLQQILINAICCVGLFAVSNFFLSRRLNLE
ncbi:MAG: hypothetical protein LIO75_00150 [Lachnospiraceae bacterium]|nr:hypothetical protein [Lachnospiraceae bacterium]